MRIPQERLVVGNVQKVSVWPYEVSSTEQEGQTLIHYVNDERDRLRTVTPQGEEIRDFRVAEGETIVDVVTGDVDFVLTRHSLYAVEGSQATERLVFEREGWADEIEVLDDGKVAVPQPGGVAVYESLTEEPVGRYGGAKYLHSLAGELWLERFRQVSVIHNGEQLDLTEKLRGPKPTVGPDGRVWFVTGDERRQIVRYNPTTGEAERLSAGSGTEAVVPLKGGRYLAVGQGGEVRMGNRALMRGGSAKLEAFNLSGNNALVTLRDGSSHRVLKLNLDNGRLDTVWKGSGRVCTATLADGSIAVAHPGGVELVGQDTNQSFESMMDFVSQHSFEVVDKTVYLGVEAGSYSREANKVAWVDKACAILGWENPWSSELPPDRSWRLNFADSTILLQNDLRPHDQISPERLLASTCEPDPRLTLNGSRLSADGYGFKGQSFHCELGSHWVQAFPVETSKGYSLAALSSQGRLHWFEKDKPDREFALGEPVKTIWTGQGGVLYGQTESGRPFEFRFSGDSGGDSSLTIDSDLVRVGDFLIPVED